METATAGFGWGGRNITEVTVGRGGVAPGVKGRAVRLRTLGLGLKLALRYSGSEPGAGLGLGPGPGPESGPREGGLRTTLALLTATEAPLVRAAAAGDAWLSIGCWGLQGSRLEL